MKSAAALWLLGLVPLAAQTPVLEDGVGAGDPPVMSPVDPGVSVSASRMFRVSGTDASARRWVMRMAEEVREDYEQLTGRILDRGFVIRCEIHNPRAVSPQGPSVRQRLDAVDNEIFIGRVDIRPDGKLNPVDLRRAILELLIAADMIRGRRADEIKDGKLVPPWLLLGVDEAIQFRKDPERSAVAVAVFGRDRALPVQEMLVADPWTMNGASFAAYTASACGLILTMLDQPGGAQLFGRMLSDLAAHEGDSLPMIRHHFQNMAASDRGVEKWWALQMAAMARPSSLQFLPAPESERALARALITEINAPGRESWRGGLAEAAVLPDGELRAQALDSILLRLRALSSTIHPLFRQATANHIAAVELIRSGPAVDPAPLLSGMDEERARLFKRLDGIDDYLNWFEVTEGDVTRPRPNPLPRARPLADRKDDPVGRYLDEVETVLDR